eukprot:573544-Pyramimonas_sp.AAC.2
MALGPVAPFDASATVLLIGGVVIHLTWTENYGDSSDNQTIMQQFQRGYQAIVADRGRPPSHEKDIWHIECGVHPDRERDASLTDNWAMFEGSMYTFVFLWTPALSPNGEDIPHGFIFASFMLACMGGSSIAAKLMSRASPAPEKYMQYVFVASAFSLLVPVWFAVMNQLLDPPNCTSSRCAMRRFQHLLSMFPTSVWRSEERQWRRKTIDCTPTIPRTRTASTHPPSVLTNASSAVLSPRVQGKTLAEGEVVGGITFDGKVQMVGFLVFEICVGIFWPSLMSVSLPRMRSSPARSQL